MMRDIRSSNRFEKDLKRLQRRGKLLAKIEVVVDKLSLDEPLALKHRPHMLSGNWAGYWELHVEPDWLLIYQLTDTKLYLVRTGTHSDLF